MSADSAARIAGMLDELELLGVKLGLERMRRVLAELGSPELGLPVVLVAGTNGKGSTCAWLASVVTAAGYKSGLFTSPHLESVEERLRIDGRSISPRRLESLLAEVLAASQRAGGDGDRVTYFEALTAAALCYFRQEGVELAVMEVGLGGRLDATNVTEPLLSLVTQIAFDHQSQLGNTLREIATEKAGVLRAGRPGLTSATDLEARHALERVAAQRGAQLSFVGDLVSLEEGRDLLAAGQRLKLRTDSADYDLSPTLGGRHQIENLSLVVAAAECLAASGFPAIDAARVERGVERCRWPGRLEWISPAIGVEVLLDAAHNPAGLEALGAYLRALRRPFWLVFGMLREKVGPEEVRRLWSAATGVVVTRPDSVRALQPEELVELVGQAPDAIVREPADALEVALEAGHLVVVCGSLYLIGEIRGRLRQTFGVPAVALELFDAGRSPGVDQESA